MNRNEAKIEITVIDKIDKAEVTTTVEGSSELIMSGLLSALAALINRTIKDRDNLESAISDLSIDLFKQVKRLEEEQQRNKDEDKPYKLK